MWLTPSSFSNVSMLFSPCLKILGRRIFAVALCRVRLSCNTLKPHIANCGNSPSAIFCVSDLRSQAEFFRRKLRTNRLRKDVGWRSLFAKTKRHLLMTDLSWPFSHVRQELRLPLFYPWLLTRQRLHQTLKHHRLKTTFLRLLGLLIHRFALFLIGFFVLSLVICAIRRICNA